MKVKLNNTGMNKNENKIVRNSMKYITGILIMCDCVCVCRMICNNEICMIRNTMNTVVNWWAASQTKERKQKKSISYAW